MNETTILEPTEAPLPVPAEDEATNDEVEAGPVDEEPSGVASDQDGAAPAHTTTWQDVAAASAQAQTPDEEVDFVEEKLSVELTDAEVLARGRMNKERLDERNHLEVNLETKRAEAKAIKTEIDELQKEIDQCTTEMGTKRALVTKNWRVVSDFRAHQERWYDPDDGRLVDTRAIPTNRRQVSLPFGGADATNGSTSSSVTDDGEDEDDAVEFGDEDVSGSIPEPDFDDDRGPDAADSTTNLTGNPFDPEDVEIDATEILEAAATPAEPVASVPPSKPTRRGRKKKAE